MLVARPLRMQHTNTQLQKLKFRPVTCDPGIPPIPGIFIHRAVHCRDICPALSEFCECVEFLRFVVTKYDPAARQITERLLPSCWLFKEAELCEKSI